MKFLSAFNINPQQMQDSGTKWTFLLLLMSSTSPRLSMKDKFLKILQRKNKSSLLMGK